MKWLYAWVYESIVKPRWECTCNGLPANSRWGCRGLGSRILAKGSRILVKSPRSESAPGAGDCIPSSGVVIRGNIN
jgi:hypothetical protein